MPTPRGSQMLPLVLGSDALHPAFAIRWLWRLELQHPLRVPAAEPSRRDALLVGAIPRDSTHPSTHGKRAAQRGEAPRSPALTLGADTPLRGFLGKCRAWEDPPPRLDWEATASQGSACRSRRTTAVPASRRSHPRDALDPAPSAPCPSMPCEPSSL